MRSPMNSNSISDDIALNIASLLEAPEVCNLGSCSKFWCDLCASDSLWLHLARKRWPDLNLEWQATPPSQFQGWKGFYISKHQSLSRCAYMVIQFVEQCINNESLEVGSYLKAVNDLRSMELGFKDVQMFLLARKHSVLLNLIGLHYSICLLRISPSDVMEALQTCQVANRQVCVSWFKLGRWFYGFRLADEQRSRKVSLGDLAMPEGEEVLGMKSKAWDEVEIEEFETMTKNATTVQKETLCKILEQNCMAEYLQALGLRGRTDPESFKACVPLVTHEDLEPYIERIVDGDTSPILTGKPVTTLSLSSGTTQGKSKFLPFNEEMLRSTMQIYRTSFAFINREYPINAGKALQFIYASKLSITKGGLVATTGTTNIYRSQQFKNTMKDIHSQCSSPDEIIFCPDYDQALYCHLLCGLVYSHEVQIISSAFAFSIVHALRTFEHIWEELCVDIRDGILSSRITISFVREAVSKILTPNPNLADTIYRKCTSLSNWYSIIPELWPNAKYVYGIMTGSMEPYAKKLQHYAGNLPLLSAYYGASEGWIGANVKPREKLESAAYAVFPDIGYFEFLPLRENPNEKVPKNIDSTNHYKELEPVGLTEVEVGKLYEVIITNFAGLYRYRLGDIVKVASFHNSTPELQFVCRRNNLLSINIDKNSEKDIQLAIDEASHLLAAENLEVVDFTSHADLSSDPGHYVIFLELNKDADEDTLKRCSNCLDLAFVESAYVRSRRNNIIGPLELRVVSSGTFQKIVDHYADHGTTLSQFKMPRCVGPSNRKVLQTLCSNVVESYFSTAYG